MLKNVFAAPASAAATTTVFFVFMLFLYPYHQQQKTQKNCTYANVRMACVFCAPATINVEMRLVCNDIQSRTFTSDVSRSTHIIISSYFLCKHCSSIYFLLLLLRFSMLMLIFSCFLLWRWFFLALSQKKQKNLLDSLCSRIVGAFVVFFFSSSSFSTTVWYEIAFDSPLSSFIGGFQWINFFLLPTQMDFLKNIFSCVLFCVGFLISLSLSTYLYLYVFIQY